jgi:hypothetical protein
MLQSEMGATELTLLGSLLAETLAEVVRHVDLCGGLFDLVVVVVVVVEWIGVGELAVMRDGGRQTRSSVIYLAHSAAAFSDVPTTRVRHLSRSSSSEGERRLREYTTPATCPSHVWLPGSTSLLLGHRLDCCSHITP